MPPLLAPLSRAVKALPTRPTRALPTRAPKLARSTVTRAAGIGEAAAAVPAMYALVSFNEYVTHRWYQHEELNAYPVVRKLAQALFNADKLSGGGHIEHHAETLDDMSLRTDAKWLRTDAAEKLAVKKWRGTAFTYEVTGLMLGQMFITCPFVLCGLLHFDIAEASALTFATTIAHGLVWNALHPAMHGLPDVELKDGLPTSWLSGLRSTAYFNWLYANHQGHHVMSGKKNYNVCCPGVDHLLGTYVPESEWRPSMRIDDSDRPQYDAREYERALAEAAAVPVLVAEKA